MSYARMDHAGWVSRHTKRELTPFQAKVCDILGIVGHGAYNAPINWDKVDWDYGYGVSVVWSRDMATWDFNPLTMLVLLCHEARVRCEIKACAPGRLRLSFWPRSHEGGIASRHPNIDEAVAEFREYLGPDHWLSYSVSLVPLSEKEAKAR